MADSGLVDRYLLLGLRLGRHIDGLVDAYYGPPAVADAVSAEPLVAPALLVAAARELLASIDAGDALGEPSAAVAPVPMARRRLVGTGSGPRSWGC